jgi:hypothetical protein
MFRSEGRETLFSLTCVAARSPRREMERERNAGRACSQSAQSPKVNSTKRARKTPDGGERKWTFRPHPRSLRYSSHATINDHIIDGPRKGANVKEALLRGGGRMQRTRSATGKTDAGLGWTSSRVGHRRTRFGWANVLRCCGQLHPTTQASVGGLVNAQQISLTLFASAAIDKSSEAALVRCAYVVVVVLPRWKHGVAGWPQGGGDTNSRYSLFDLTRSRRH